MSQKISKINEGVKISKNSKYKIIWAILVSIILILGVGLIYLVSSQFGISTAGKDVYFPEGVPTTTVKLKNLDYLAPDFVLMNESGSTTSLRSLRGKTVVLTFWTTWNPLAQDQLAVLRDFYKTVKEADDLIVVVVNSQEEKSSSVNFLRRGEYNLPVMLFDESGEVSELYKINSVPTTYFISPKGRIKNFYVGVLDEQRISDEAAVAGSE